MIYPFSASCEVYGERKIWVARSKSLKGCLGQGDTLEQAIAELQDNEKGWLETAEVAGIPIPEVPDDAVENYSGKMTIRVSPSVHMKAAQKAKQEGISLNQYINDAIVTQNSIVVV